MSLYDVLQEADAEPKNQQDTLEKAKQLLGGEREPGVGGHAVGNGGLTSALHLAITKHESPELVKLLCEHGADVQFESQVTVPRRLAALHSSDCATVEVTIRRSSRARNSVQCTCRQPLPRQASDMFF